ncbi:hypothetical protein GCM10025867_46350 (plasmid) [Frondihabitans sucicola]|uniref:Uncharacterized protein n=1 Tax=Frondihabitans sucicola TaxID=1268041 RepID=A0ABN6Y504_9MICO|nr:hypothetical protein [Frondihabitans sucicola]BDZ52394.1 hypothetical protein GCM10025867_46350 [Frondihabitans sucicola]
MPAATTPATKVITRDNVAPGDTIHERCLTIVNGETVSVLQPLRVTFVDGEMICGKFKGDRKERLIFNPVFDA